MNKNKKFWYAVKVINSCKHPQQLAVTKEWVDRVFDKYENFENFKMLHEIIRTKNKQLAGLL